MKRKLPSYIRKTLSLLTLVAIIILLARNYY
jgi:hypothetical protein